MGYSTEEQDRYQGWTNYETWAVKLHMDNEQSSQEYWAKRAQEEAEAAEANKFGTTKERVAVRELADCLQIEHERALPELQGFAGDLLTAALCEVNWYEIAESLLEAVLENATA